MAQVSKRGRWDDSRQRLAALLSPRVFKALADPKRASLLVRLAGAAGGCTVGEVAEGSGVDLSVVSRHLALLRDAGIIRCERRGKEVRCSIDAPALTRFLRELADAVETCCPAGDVPAVAGRGRSREGPRQGK